MIGEAWIAVVLIFIIVWGFILWEIWTAPLYPDDYDAPFEVNGSKNKIKQTKKRKTDDKNR